MDIQRRLIRLTITDNAWVKEKEGKWTEGWLLKDTCSELSEQVFNDNLQQIEDDLKKISGKKLGGLVKNNPKLLVFPYCLNANNDDIADLSICSYNEETKRLYTGNMMGFVGVGNTQISIRSRFANTEAEDYFLHYMIMKVFCPNIVNLSHQKSKESVFDFLLYMFPKFFNEALSQGVYKEYRRFEYNDSKVKGTIDVSRHIRYNIPFNGRIAYSTREYSTDNRITQLVRHTIEFIKASPLGRGILSDKTTQDNIRLVTDCTSSYSKGDRNKVLSANIREVRHPYFTKYTALQKLCVSILRHEELKYGNSDNEVYGILFDGAWLWEEYLNVVFKPLGLTHAKNKTKKNGYSLFGNKTYMRYPDFYKENDIVIDAKYKHLGGEIERDDIHQIITYLHTLNATKGAYLAYPIDNEKETGVEEVGELNGFGGKIGLIGLKIPQNVAKLENFIAEINIEEGNLIKQIKQYL